MSLFSSFKKALGFPDEYEDLDDLADLEDVDEPEVAKPSDLSEDANACVDTPVENTESFIDMLANRIAETSATSPEDRKKIRTAAENILQREMPLQTERLRQAAERNWLRERSGLVKELNELKKVCGEIDSQKMRFETNRLSSERQKRALNERLDDMEKQILTLEAEREQLVLENRSMLNRLRGVVTENVMPSDSHKNAEFKRLSSENSELRRKNQELQKALDESGSEQGDSAELSEGLKMLEQKLEKFEDIKNKKDNEIKALRQENELLCQENEDFGKRLVISDQQINSLEQKVAELHKTISENLSDHARDEEKLKKEIRRLSELVEQSEKNLKTAAKVSSKAEKTSKKKDNTDNKKITAIDELIDSTDWFSAPAPGPRAKDPEVTENFGYKEKSKKKTSKTDENQLTLF